MIDLQPGAFFWGVLADIIGRRWAFNATVLVSSAFGIGLGGVDTYNAFLVLTAFVGFGVGGITFTRHRRLKGNAHRPYQATFRLTLRLR